MGFFEDFSKNWNDTWNNIGKSFELAGEEFKKGNFWEGLSKGTETSLAAFGNAITFGGANAIGNAIKDGNIKDLFTVVTPVENNNEKIKMEDVSTEPTFKRIENHGTNLRRIDGNDIITEPVSGITMHREKMKLYAEKEGPQELSETLNIVRNGKLEGKTIDDVKQEIMENDAKSYALMKFYENAPSQMPGQPTEAYDAQLEELKKTYMNSDEYKSEYERLLSNFKENDSSPYWDGENGELMSLNVEELKNFDAKIKDGTGCYVDDRGMFHTNIDNVAQLHDTYPKQTPGQPTEAYEAQLKAFKEKIEGYELKPSANEETQAKTGEKRNKFNSLDAYVTSLPSNKSQTKSEISNGYEDV